MANFWSRILPVGRRSLLFGVHNILWHPYTVYRAWKKLYGKPSRKELYCIFVHDWGYWNAKDMDGETGRDHSEYGAKLARKKYGDEYGELVLFHSRHYAVRHGAIPSKLCWADKYSILYDWKWFYLLRAKLSGEIKEYRKSNAHLIDISKSDSEWFDYVRASMKKLAESESPDIIPYQIDVKKYKEI